MLHRQEINSILNDNEGTISQLTHSIQTLETHKAALVERLHRECEFYVPQKREDERMNLRLRQENTQLHEQIQLFKWQLERQTNKSAAYLKRQRNEFVMAERLRRRVITLRRRPPTDATATAGTKVNPFH